MTQEFYIIDFCGDEHMEEKLHLTHKKQNKQNQTKTNKQTNKQTNENHYVLYLYLKYLYLSTIIVPLGKTNSIFYISKM